MSKLHIKKNDTVYVLAGDVGIYLAHYLTVGGQIFVPIFVDVVRSGLVDGIDLEIGRAHV